MEIGERERGGQASSKREEDELKRGEKKEKKKEGKSMGKYEVYEGCV